MADKSNLIRRIIFRLVRKRIAGSTSDSVIKKLRELNGSGLHTTATLLNDHVGDTAKARYNTNAYVQFIKQTARLRLNTDVSFRLSQLGYGLDAKSARSNMGELVDAAKEGGLRLWIEDEPQIDAAERFGVYRDAKRRYPNVGIEVRPEHLANGSAINKMLTGKDTVKVRRYPASHDEEGMDAHKAELKGYSESVGRLLKSKAKVTVLDGDVSILNRISNANRDYRRDLIVELPLGYNSRKAQKLAKGKLNMSVYVPYGKDWIPYITERLIDGKTRKLAAALLNDNSADENYAGSAEDE